MKLGAGDHGVADGRRNNQPAPASTGAIRWPTARKLMVFCFSLGILCALLLVGGAMGPTVSDTAAGASAENTSNETANVSAPVLEDAERVTDTKIAVTIETEAGLDSETVIPSEFFLSAGTLTEATLTNTSQEDENATIELELVDPVAEDEVVIGVSSSTQLADTAGNTLNTSEQSSVTATGMDAVPPELLSVDIPSISTNQTTLGYQFDQSVAELSVTIDGPAEKQLTREDFEERPNREYTSDLSLEAEGEYTVTIHNATDEAGNRAEFDTESSLEINTSVPAAIAAVNRSASAGTTVVFDGNHSDSTAESFGWSFGDGETATGEQVEHTFHPGVYAVTLETTDAAGNVGTDERIIKVSTDEQSPRVGSQHWPDEPEVSVERLSSAFGADTLVEVSGLSAGEAVTAGEGDKPLTETEETTVESVTLTPTTDTSIGLGLTGIEADDPVAADFAEETEMKALGGFSASPTVGADILDETEMTIAVTESAIDAADATIDDVALYHGNGVWEERETAVRDEGDGIYELAVTTDTFSPFVLGVPDETEDEEKSEEQPNNETDDESEEEGDGDADENGSDEDEAEDGEEDSEEDESEEEESDEEETNNESDDGSEPESNETDENNETEDPDDEPPEPAEGEDEEEENGAFLGILPHWLVISLILFIALPLFTAYTGLKAIAFYLGY